LRVDEHVRAGPRGGVDNEDADREAIRDRRGARRADRERLLVGREVRGFETYRVLALRQIDELRRDRGPDLLAIHEEGGQRNRAELHLERADLRRRLRFLRRLLLGDRLGGLRLRKRGRDGGRSLGERRRVLADLRRRENDRGGRGRGRSRGRGSRRLGL